MVVTQHVQYAVQNQPANFIERGMAFRGGIAPGRLHGNHHVAQEILDARRAPGGGSGRAFASGGAAASFQAKESTSVALSLPR